MRVLFFALVAAVIYALYFQVLDNPVWFDSHAWSAVPSAVPLKSWLTFITDFRVTLARDLASLTGGLVANLSTSMKAQYALNVFIHGINSLLVYSFINQLFKNRRLSMFMMLFYAVNPAAIFGVAYLVQRTILMGAMFGLLQVNLFWKALNARWMSPVYFLLSLWCYTLACMCKEHCAPLIAVYPIFLIAYRQLNVKTIAYFVLSAVIGFYLYKNLISFWGLIENESFTEYYAPLVQQSCGLGDSHLLYRSIITQAGLFFKYFVNWVYPFPMSIEIRDDFMPNLRSLPHLLGALGFILTFITGAILILIKRFNLLGMGILLSLALFGCEFSRVRIGEMFVMYRSTLFSIGFVVVIAYFLDKLPKKVLLALFLIPVITGFITYKRLQAFDSGAKVWRQAADIIDMSDPSKKCSAFRVFGNEGMYLIQEGKFKEAEKYLKQSLEIYPEYGTAKMNLVSLYFLTGRFSQAMKLGVEIMNADYDKLNKWMPAGWGDIFKSSTQTIFKKMAEIKTIRGTNEDTASGTVVSE